MKERPILFSASMVRALLDGSKTQTRRVVKLPHMNPLGVWEPMTIGGPNGGRTKAGETIPEQGSIWHTRTGDGICCPYGQPGDRLWVRENGWERPDRTPKMMREGADTWRPYYFDADGLSFYDSADFKEWGFKRRPSIHMPRWASRITLEITGVRVERLQEISEGDALAEGVSVHQNHHDKPRTSIYGPVQAYRDLWEQINGTGSWDANPLVWVVEFNRVMP